jgi:hypothetical protein
MNEIIQTPVGADLSCPPPIDRHGKRINGPVADQSALRQSIVRRRDVVVVGRSSSSSPFSLDIPRAAFTSHCALLTGETATKVGLMYIHYVLRPVRGNFS